MSLTLKIGSLVIRTLSKPIANYIKRNAREHERFRKVCVGFAQRLHRFDMRLRLGLLQDPAAIDRQIAREFAEAEAKRKKTAVPTVKNEADMKADLAKTAKEKDDVSKKVKAEHKPPRIRPLSESRAIETGANFISEGFLFLVAGGLILWETQRNRRKQEREHDARDDEIERIGHENATIKGEVEQLKQELAFVRGGSPKAEDETNAERGASPPNVTKISLSPELEKRIATSNESQKPA